MTEVCIGDRYRIGTALFEVTQPRVTCYRVGIRMDEPRMASLLVSHGRPGFYLRVLQEGEVGAGDEVEKVLEGPERMTVAQVNALLYLPGHRREDVQRALRIPALSPGWKLSFGALLREPSSADSISGNPGLSSEAGPPPAWHGFRTLRISRIDADSAAVLSLILVPTGGLPLAAPLPGQFVVVRLRPTPDRTPLLRSYSLSDAPTEDHYRISVKQEENGDASRYLHQHARVGDLLEVSAPRGAFTLGSGDGPVVLLGAGVGITPLLANAARAGGQCDNPAGVVVLRGAQCSRSSLRFGIGPAYCSAFLQAEGTSSTAGLRTRKSRVTVLTHAGTWMSRPCVGSTYLETPTITSAGRPHSCAS